MSIVKSGIESVLYPWMENHRENRVRSYLAELEKSEKLSAPELTALQDEKLRRLLTQALTTVPAYRPWQYLLPLGNSWAPRPILASLPALSKDEFMADPASYLSSAADPARLIANHSGGSSGRPVRFSMDRVTVEHYEAARWRGLARFNITPGSPSVMIWGNPYELTAAQAGSYRRRERWLKNRILISSYELDPRRIKDQVARIDRFRPEYLYGYASSLTAFAQLMLDQGLRLRRELKAVVSTAETLFDHQQEILKKAFSCPVVNEYGARDAGILAYSCPEGGLHINVENVIIEIVDPKDMQPLPPGKEGAILVTDLHNFVQPRLRYRLDDVGALSPYPCSCGRALPLLNHVAGREDSMLVRPDGVLVHGYAFSYGARLFSAIRQFRIIQHAPESATLRLVVDRSQPQAEEDAAGYIRRCEELLPGTAIMVLYCDDIPPADSGKLRYSIREFPLSSREADI